MSSPKSMSSPKRTSRFPFGGKKTPPRTGVTPTAGATVTTKEVLVINGEETKTPNDKNTHSEEQKKPGFKLIKAAAKSLGMGNMIKHAPTAPEDNSITTGGEEYDEQDEKAEEEGVVAKRETAFSEEKDQIHCEANDDKLNGHVQVEETAIDYGYDQEMTIAEGSFPFEMSFFSFEIIVLTVGATYLTILNEAKILNNEVPLVVAGLWIAVAFALGYKCNCSVFENDVFNEEAITLDETSVSVDLPATSVRASIIKRSHMLRRLFIRPTRRSKESLRTSQGKIWTALNPKDKVRFRWQHNVDPTLDEKNSSLMQKLLKSQRFRRKRKTGAAAGDASHTEATAQVPMPEDAGHEIGSFNVGDTVADTLDDYVIEPIFKLRGMDIFLTDDPETNVAQHPWLIRQGLRSVPTYIVNILTQWGNILLYFEMPRWVNDWDNLQENHDDPDDVIAIKRFIKGDDEYRNKRLKLVPSVVQAPAPVRMLAPPKKGRTVNSPLVPVRWAKNNVETAEDGTKLCVALESELDCVSNKMMRGMASIVKRNLHVLAIDAAVIIEKPDGQLEDEPSACVGLWRFNHIDISKCPKFPDRFAEEAARTGKNPDFLRASIVVCSAPE